LRAGRTAKEICKLFYPHVYPLAGLPGTGIRVFRRGRGSQAGAEVSHTHTRAARSRIARGCARADRGATFKSRHGATAHHSRDQTDDGLTTQRVRSRPGRATEGDGEKSRPRTGLRRLCKSAQGAWSGLVGRGGAVRMWVRQGTYKRNSSLQGSAGVQLEQPDERRAEREWTSVAQTAQHRPARCAASLAGGPLATASRQRASKRSVAKSSACPSCKRR